MSARLISNPTAGGQHDVAEVFDTYAKDSQSSAQQQRSSQQHDKQNVPHYLERPVRPTPHSHTLLACPATPPHHAHSPIPPFALSP